MYFILLVVDFMILLSTPVFHCVIVLMQRKILFLVAPKRLYKSACPSVRRSVGRSVMLCNAFAVMLLPTRSDLCRVDGLVFLISRKDFEWLNVIQVKV